MPRGGVIRLGPLVVGLVVSAGLLCVHGWTAGHTELPRGQRLGGARLRAEGGSRGGFGEGGGHGGCGGTGALLRLRGGAKFSKNEKVDDLLDRTLGGVGKNKKKAQEPPSPLERAVVDSMWALREEDGLRIIKYLHIRSAQEVAYGESGQRAVVVMVPYVEMVEYRKIGQDFRPKLPRPCCPISKVSAPFPPASDLPHSALPGSLTSMPRVQRVLLSRGLKSSWLPRSSSCSTEGSSARRRAACACSSRSAR
jgi:hypothetical protein